MSEATREQLRDSIVTHLTALKAFGVKTAPTLNLPEELTRSALNPSPTTSPRPTQNNEHTTALPPTPAALNTPLLSGVTSLEALSDHIGECERCGLCEKRKNIVFGVGNPHADLMLIGEGPGADEDEQGEPFVGRAGQLLDKIVKAMGYERQDIYIANVVKCRPPNNRNPEPDEIANCMPFLKKQIQLVQPKVIMCLGKFAAQTVLNSQMAISRMRGTFQTVDGIQVMPAFHPAYLLRNPGAKRIMWEDCKKVMALLAE